MASVSEDWHSESSYSLIDSTEAEEGKQFDSNDSCDAKIKKEQKRRPKPRDGSQLFCRVCGDKALGYNFDAVTCESCKAFFRRNANKAKSFTCCFDGNCKLDPHTRKFCSGCRLKKCFTIGMKKDWILNDEQLAKRRQRLRARTATCSSSSCEQESPSSTGEISSQGSHISEETYSPPPAPALSGSPELPVKEEPPDEENYTIPLRDDIRENLTQMQKTYDEIFEATYSPEQVGTVIKENPSSSTDLFNMTDIFIRRLIKFAKCIPEFKSLKQEDQIHLLKGGIMEMFVLRSAMAFDARSSAWKFRMQSQQRTDVSAIDSHVIQKNLGSNMYLEHMRFVQSIHELTRSDRIVLMLLFVIDLMSSDRPNLSNQVVVSKAQEKFSMWLKAYLESILTVGEARHVYPKLLMKLLDVRNLGEESSQLAAKLDISKLEPLLVEIFDLKQ
ncbi:nuclear hormone receptor HR96-like isoform X3 [Pomacea canaliculata]|nr:nuclear hormone receptor HR96-like isoform X3 [Pomacea canaliculata]